MILRQSVAGIIALRGVCIFILPDGATPSGVHRLTFRRETTYDNLLPPEAVNLGIAQQTRSGIHCAKLCREEEWCNSYFYNDVTRICLRHRAVYLAPPAFYSLSEAGWRYFRRESVCPAGKDYVADRLSSTCYRLDLSLKKWTTARDDCAANGEMLVVLEPVVKAQFIKNFLTANRHHTWRNAYIGATQVPLMTFDFTWLNGEPVNITATKSFWMKNRPSNIIPDGVLLLKYSKYFQWSEAHNRALRHSICERPFLQ